MFLSFLSFQSFSLIFIFDWFKLLQESKVENAIYFVFLEICKQKFEATEFEFPALKLLLSPKPFHCLFTFWDFFSLLCIVCLHSRDFISLLCIGCLHSQDFISLLCNFISLLCNFISLLCNFCLHHRKLFSLVIVLI